MVKYHSALPSLILPIQYAWCTDFSILPGIELDEERGIDGDSDFTIRGRLMSLVEKVAYLKKKMANLPKEKKDRQPSKSSTSVQSNCPETISDIASCWADGGQLKKF